MISKQCLCDKIENFFNRIKIKIWVEYKIFNFHSKIDGIDLQFRFFEQRKNDIFSPYHGREGNSISLITIPTLNPKRSRTSFGSSKQTLLELRKQYILNINVLDRYKKMKRL